MRTRHFVLSTGTPGACGLAAECSITDNVSLLGWLVGAYVQDEWKLSSQLTLNTGVRFDQMSEFVEYKSGEPPR